MVYFLGGFGNNLFQLALFYELLAQGNRETKINIYLLKNNFLTRLLKWNRHDHSMILKVLLDLDTNQVEDQFSWRVILAVCYYFILRALFPNHLRLWHASPVSQRIGYIGYFQKGPHLNTETYNELRTLVLPSLPPHEIGCGTAAVVHVRRGDFSNLQNVSLEEQIKLAKSLCTRSGSILIITDDAGEVSNELSGLRLGDKSDVFVREGTPESDFRTLLSAPKIVCSPSTFCYWGFVLGAATAGCVPSVLSRGERNEWEYSKNVTYY